MLSGSTDKQVIFWNSKDFSFSRKIENLPDQVLALASNDIHFAIGLKNSEIQIYNSSYLLFNTIQTSDYITSITILKQNAELLHNIFNVTAKLDSNLKQNLQELQMSTRCA